MTPLATVAVIRAIADAIRVVAIRHTVATWAVMVDATVVAAATDVVTAMVAFTLTTACRPLGTHQAT